MAPALGGDLAAEGIRLMVRSNAEGRTGENSRSALVGADVWFEYKIFEQS